GKRKDSRCFAGWVCSSVQSTRPFGGPIVFGRVDVPPGEFLPGGNEGLNLYVPPFAKGAKDGAPGRLRRFDEFQHVREQPAEKVKVRGRTADPPGDDNKQGRDKDEVVLSLLPLTFDRTGCILLSNIEGMMAAIAD